MKPATKVFFNTIVLYFKIIISMAISLITVPIVLNSLGQSDYGLYSLTAGVAAMLGFLNNSMSVSTQRFMSVTMGEGNLKKVIQVFNVNIMLHLLLGIIVVVALEIIGLFIFDSLNIIPESIGRAKIIYHFFVISAFSNIICAPLNGVINAREDMFVFTIIGILDSLLSLSVAITLSYIHIDKLVFYGFGMMIVPIFTYLATLFYVRKAYPEYEINLKKYADKNLFSSTFKFAGWNLFGAIANICRNQGVAVIINLFLGTVSNAAYGISNQINSALSNFTSTFQKALNPQLMKSEGMKDKNRLIKISFISSKIGVLSIAFFAIPVIIEMPEILNIWLKGNIPIYTVELSQFIILFSIVAQYSTGLMSSIQAVGKIRNYQITMSLIILLNLPIAYMILKFKFPIYYITISFVVLEIISLITRIIFSKNIVGIKFKDYFKSVLLPTLIIIAISTSIGLIPHFAIENTILRIIMTIVLYCSVFIVLFWYIAIENEQRIYLKTQVFKILKLNK